MENEIKTPAIMVDVDGTLALMHHKRSPFDWDKVGMDLPNKSVITLVNNLYKLREIAYCASEEIAILIMSGRDGEILDDRNQVVDMWRSIGLPCFQVAPGNF
jgi:hypothetical protein